VKRAKEIEATLQYAGGRLAHRPIRPRRMAR
jgi:hypothetical protein